MLRSVCLGIFLVGALASSGPGTADTLQAQAFQEELAVELRSMGIDPEVIDFPGAISDEMKKWVHERVPAGLSPEAAMRRVLTELVDPRGFRLVYNPDFTGTAEEVWKSREANCLGFTHLFVALTREVGIPTYYVQWERVERFRREGDLVLVSGHVSAGLGPANQRMILEFGAVDGFESQLAQPISDLNAISRHYANRSAEMLRTGHVDTAVQAAELATRLDPSLADAWVNLGVSKRRSGDSQGAMEAYQQATLVDPDHVPAYQNLSILMHLSGEKDAAQETLALLDRRDNRNPFTYLALGDSSLSMGRIEEAERFFHRAHKLDPSLAETRAARGIVALYSGNQKAAEKWLRRAQAVNPEESRTRELAKRLSNSQPASK